MRLKVFIHLLLNHFVITAMGYYLCCEKDHIIFFLVFFPKIFIQLTIYFKTKTLSVTMLVIFEI